MTPELKQSLAMAAEMAAKASDPWWLIGSAAVVLFGGKISHVKDVDLMMSARDAEAFLQRTGASRGTEKSDRFRSKVFGTWSAPPVPVEVFGGFEVATDGAWRPVTFETREAIVAGHTQIFVPSRSELVRLLKTFGRPKDHERARLIQGA